MVLHRSAKPPDQGKVEFHVAINEQAQSAIDALEALDVEVEVTGGGRGWTATTNVYDSDVSAKATSKVGALEALLALVQKRVDEEEGDESNGEEIEGCGDECQNSSSAFCQCKCGGEGHGAALGKSGAIMIGSKPCKCGCGESTKRTFVPGHDARYHGLVALREWAKATGTTGSDEDLRKAKAAALRKAARERRAVQRAKLAAKAAESFKTIAPKPGKSRKRQALALNMTAHGPAIIAADDLPF